MKLTFYGAAREVTGSCFYLEASGKKILIDCGMQQGHDEKENEQLPFIASQIDFVLVTHAHIDHSGRLPLLAKDGFKGKVYATGASCDLLNIMLRDSAHIQEMEAQWKNQKGKRAGNDETQPLYSMADAEAILTHLERCDYQKPIQLAEGITVRFDDAGHLLGSASLEVMVTEGRITKKLVFSGDIGNSDQPILNDPSYIKEADYVIMESTYGDRLHEPSEDYTLDLANIIDKTLKRGGNVIIPSFAVGRTQELLYFIRDIKERKLVQSHPDFPVYVDSPLATEATAIYTKNMKAYGDQDAKELLGEGIQPLVFKNLHMTQSSDESKALNFMTAPKVIIASSGMCEAGRIRHHLKHNLWREECSVVFVGYQANGTLGRIILDGVQRVKLFGEEVAVKAEIVNFKGMSGHADQNGLIKWITSFTKRPGHVFLVHGEEEVSLAFAGILEPRGFSVSVPEYGDTIDLAVDTQVADTAVRAPAPVKREQREEGSEAYLRLVNAANRLMDVIHDHKTGSKKDLARFADQILALRQKWEH